jgi:small subunit ribosomal protein S1
MSTEKKEDTFAALFEAEAHQAKGAQTTRRRPRVGDRLEAVVVQVGRDTVFLELDGKQQAIFEASELRDPDGTMTVKEGDKIAAQVVEVDDRRGIVRLGRSVGKPGSAAALEQAKEAMLPVEGKVTGVNKGGIEVDIGGARAFCPMSQIDKRPVEDAKALIGQTLRFLVTDVREGGKNVVVSRRALLQREASDAAERILAELAPGSIVRGTVTSVRDFGAFVDLGGIEGLIPRSEISHDRQVAVADALKAGDNVEVLVREMKDAEPTRGGGPTKKITLSLKGLKDEPAPAPRAAGAEGTKGPALTVGAIVTGAVTRIETYGIFLQVDGTKGREGRGLVPNAELGVPRGTDLRKAFPEGTKLTAKILETGDGRLRLSVKGAKDAEERADFEAARGKASATGSLGTFADLLAKSAAKKKK